MTKKILLIIFATLFLATAPATVNAIPLGGSGTSNEEAYVCGGGYDSFGKTSIGSNNFVSGPLGKGWRITSGGVAEFQNAFIRGVLHTTVFEKDTINCVNGMVLVSGADVLDADMTALDASTLTITGENTFLVNEVIRIKDGTDDEWMLVTDASSAPTYTVTRDLAGSYSEDSNPAWATGTAVVSMGVGAGTKTGFILMDASSANSPFMDIYARNSATYSDYTLKARLGWLKGIVDTDVGLNSTDVWGLYSDSVYLKGTIVSSSGAIGGWTLGTYEIKDTAGNTGMNCNVTAGDDVRFWAGSATPASAPFNVTEAGALTASSATITGVVTANTGYIGGTNGWTIAEGKMTSTGIGIATSTGDSTYAFWAGDNTSGSAEFRVGHDGSLVASSATITGAITASSGSITGDLVMGNTGAIYSTGKSSYADTDAGFFIGYDTDGYKLNLGDAFSYLKWNGVSVDTQFRNIVFNQETAPDAPTCTEGAAGNLNGVYYYRLTFVTANGETEYGTASAPITVVDKKVELSSIPTGTTKCTARKIYRTAAGASAYACQYVGTISDNTTTTYSDNLADGSLGSSVPSSNTTGGVMSIGATKIFVVNNQITAIGSNVGLHGSLAAYFGESAGRAVTSGQGNSFYGSGSGRYVTEGDMNTFGGGASGFYTTTGDNNSFYGYGACSDNTTGSNNCAFGAYAGYWQSTGVNSLQTPENSVYIGYNSKSGSDPAGGEDDIQNEIVIGYNTTGNGTNTITLGHSGITEFHCQVALTVDSDARIKQDVTPLPSSLDFINSLTPITYRKISPDQWPEEIRLSGAMPSKDDRVYLGLIAQDVECKLEEQGIDWNLVQTGVKGKKSITYEGLIMPLIKAVQELSDKVDAIEGRLN